MGLHRLWVIPGGAGPADGAYLRFPADEQWAAVCIEAARAHGGVVGENLGTVPPETEGALAAHGVLGTWVAQFAPGAGAPPARSLACVDTHDLPTFASWWHDLDPARRGELLETLREAGALDTTYGEILAPDDVHAALLEWLGASDAALVLVTLEDLWLEAEAQNRPGTHAHQSFRRRFAYGVDDLDALDAGVLARLDGARRRRPWS
jgi:4-alpha-glucanotransferase